MAVKSVRDGKRKPKKVLVDNQIEVNGELIKIPEFSEFRLRLLNTPNAYSPFCTKVECTFRNNPTTIISTLFTDMRSIFTVDSLRLRGILVGLVASYYLKQVLKVKVTYPSQNDARAVKVMNYLSYNNAHDALIDQFVQDMSVVQVMHS